MLKRSIVIVALMAMTTPAGADWTLPCLFGGCSISIRRCFRQLMPLTQHLFHHIHNAMLLHTDHSRETSLHCFRSLSR